MHSLCWLLFFISAIDINSAALLIISKLLPLSNLSTDLIPFMINGLMTDNAVFTSLMNKPARQSARNFTNLN
jgi:hypothetical protein